MSSATTWSRTVCASVIRSAPPPARKTLGGMFTPARPCATMSSNTLPRFAREYRAMVPLLRVASTTEKTPCPSTQTSNRGPWAVIETW